MGGGHRRKASSAQNYAGTEEKLRSHSKKTGKALMRKRNLKQSQVGCCDWIHQPRNLIAFVVLFFAVLFVGSRIDAKRTKHWKNDSVVVNGGTEKVRFKVGDTVFANYEDGYKLGKISMVWDGGNPYRITLATGSDVWARADNNQFVRRVCVCARARAREWEEQSGLGRAAVHHVSKCRQQLLSWCASSFQNLTLLRHPPSSPLPSSYIPSRLHPSLSLPPSLPPFLPGPSAAKLRDWR